MPQMGTNFCSRFHQFHLHLSQRFRIQYRVHSVLTAALISGAQDGHWTSSFPWCRCPRKCKVKLWGKRKRCVANTTVPCNCIQLVIAAGPKSNKLWKSFNARPTVPRVQYDCKWCQFKYFKLVNISHEYFKAQCVVVTATSYQVCQMRRFRHVPSNQTDDSERTKRRMDFCEANWHRLLASVVSLGFGLHTNLLAFTFCLRSFTSCNTEAIPAFKFNSAWYDLSMLAHVYACGPKTVPVKRTFLNVAIVGWGGVGWGGGAC